MHDDGIYWIKLHNQKLYNPTIDIYIYKSQGSQQLLSSGRQKSQDQSTIGPGVKSGNPLEHCAYKYYYTFRVKKMESEVHRYWWKQKHNENKKIPPPPNHSESSLSCPILLFIFSGPSTVGGVLYVQGRFPLLMSLSHVLSNFGDGLRQTQE